MISVSSKIFQHVWRSVALLELGYPANGLEPKTCCQTINFIEYLEHLPKRRKVEVKADVSRAKIYHYSEIQ